MELDDFRDLGCKEKWQRLCGGKRKSLGSLRTQVRTSAHPIVKCVTLGTFSNLKLVSVFVTGITPKLHGRLIQLNDMAAKCLTDLFLVASPFSFLSSNSIM